MFSKKFKSTEKRERPTLQSRSHLGVMEHKKEWKIRQRAYKDLKNKQNDLKKATELKNPDEFYIAMNDLKFDQKTLIQDVPVHEYDQIPQINLFAAQKKLKKGIQELQIQQVLGNENEKEMNLFKKNLRSVEKEIERRNQENAILMHNGVKYVDSVTGDIKVQINTKRRK
ncbi:U3 small nucleolar RNA-associated protein 11 [Spironucleus salmonicida]|uniref:U3 small nucleolar RNA-associated protein 11 n=1 Tax=Spironucleus salmonicida TaxID=348837 RepID=V6LCA7_9EUKA|nr:U3 small nucleolar RNA-associated protein 11 [Spironucleus salmonicida]|eukprot:EST42135.1 U3 small nucleolar RNA-associated protein 11 [Spironucleus salmonicida]